MTEGRMATGDVHVTYRDVEDKWAVPPRGDGGHKAGRLSLSRPSYAQAHRSQPLMCMFQTDAFKLLELV
jgi:hypothetical protein